MNECVRQMNGSRSLLLIRMIYSGSDDVAFSVERRGVLDGYCVPLSNAVNGIQFEDGSRVLVCRGLDFWRREGVLGCL